MTRLDLRLRSVHGIGLKDVACSIKSGDALYIKGPTGSGKTTLLNIFAGIIPAVSAIEFEGSFLVDGTPCRFEEHRKRVSFAHQDAENQFILSTVEDELFSGSTAVERREAQELLQLFGIEHVLHRAIRDLSTGQRKIVSLVYALSRSRAVYLLDEPTANLDAAASRAFAQAITRLPAHAIIIIASHDDSLARICNRFLVASGRRWSMRKSYRPPAVRHARAKPARIGPDAIVLDAVSCHYAGEAGVSKVSARIPYGSITAVVGGNGSGKTTLLRVLAGKLAPSEGRCVRLPGRVAMVMQEPDKQLFTRTVRDEMRFMNTIAEEEIATLLDRFGFAGMEGCHPYFLSRGQKQILVILSVLAHRPGVLIIDEPFTGLDAESGRRIVALLRSFHRQYAPTIILADQDEARVRQLASTIITVGP